MSIEPEYEISDIRKKISECFYAFDLDTEWNFENLYLTTDLELKDLLRAIQALINLRIIDFTIDLKTKLPIFSIKDNIGYEKYKPICYAKYIINQWNN